MITTSDYVQFREPTHDEFIANIAKAVRNEYENYHKHVPAEEVEQMVSIFPEELWEEQCAAYCTEDSLECVALSRKTYDAVGPNSTSSASTKWSGTWHRRESRNWKLKRTQRMKK